jgi:hypothetical protein
MAEYRADPDLLDRLAASLDAARCEVTTPSAAGRSILAAFGYLDAAVELGAPTAAAESWGARWSGSLRGRTVILRADQTVPVRRGAFNSDLAATAAASAVYFAAAGSSAKDQSVGGSLAVSLLEALEDQHLDEVEKILESLGALDDGDVVEFFERLGIDIVGLIPQLLVDAGVHDGELATYLAPMGAALGIASRVGDGMALSFTGAEMMAGHEGSSVSPAAYFSFGVFSPEFLFSALAGVLAGFGESELPMWGPEYLLPDGTTASPDPRLPLLRAVLAMDITTQQGFLRFAAGQGAMPSLIAPATEWGDGGDAVGALLRSLVGAPDDSSWVITEVMGAAAAAGRLASSIALGAASMIAPHLPSLVLSTVFGEGGVTLDQTALRTPLETVPDAQGVVRQFFGVVMADSEARTVINAAFAALLAASVAAHLDPADTDSLAPLADDFGVLWELVFGTSLQVDLENARQQDAAVSQMGDAANLAIGSLLSGGGASIAAAGFSTWIADAVGGAGLAKAPIVAMLGGTDDVERVLLDGFAAIEDAELAAAAVLAAELNRRSVIELPPALLDEDGAPRLESAADVALLMDAFSTAGIDPTAWFNDVVAIFAYGIPSPR